MINSIKMSNCATYCFDGSKIDNCKRINFIYGSNGSGKSTISNYLNEPSSSTYKDCITSWENNLPLDVIVYNRTFREANFSTNQSSIAGIFTLGKATIDDINELNQIKLKAENKQNELNGVNTTLTKLKENINAKNSAFRNNAWDSILKKYKTIFGTAFTGLMNNSEKFKDCLLQKYNSYIPPTSTYDDLITRAGTLYTAKAEKVLLSKPKLLSFIDPFTEIENHNIWQKIIVGNNSLPISELINSLGNSDWIKEGRSYLSEDDVCPFCQQHTLTKDLKNQIKQFFSGNYETNMNLISSLNESYTLAVDALKNSLDEILNYSALFTIGKLDYDEVQNLITLITTVLQGNLTNITDKEKEPSRTISFSSTIPEINKLVNILSPAYINIENHNKIIDNFKTEQDKLSADVWNYLISEHKAMIDTYISDIKGIKNGVTSLSKQLDAKKLELKTLNDSIVSKGKNITSVKPTVDEINRLLSAYGFDNFRIVESSIQENYYQIQRPDGTIVNNTLSEGEETFISFLYFMQLAKGGIDENHISSKKVLIIDDPICSLDSTILYIVSAMIKDLIRSVTIGQSDVEQIFILTHNVFFHKEVSFVNGGSNPCRDIFYWILRKDNNKSHFVPYEMNNPIKTSYELLWSELKNNISTSFITIQNAMRRIVENYFGMLGSSKIKDEKLIESFPSIEERMICRSLLYWINDGSHSIPDDFFIDSYSDSAQKYSEVFKQIFIYTGNEAHYNMMMGIEIPTVQKTSSSS